MLLWGDKTIPAKGGKAKTRPEKGPLVEETRIARGSERRIALLMKRTNLGENKLRRKGAHGRINLGEPGPEGHFRSSPNDKTKGN